MKRLIYPILILFLTTMACSIGSFGRPAPTVAPSATPLFEVPTDIPVVQAVPTATVRPPEPTNPPTKANPTATTQLEGESNTGNAYFNEDFQNGAGNWNQWVAAGDPSKNYTKVLPGRLRFELPSAETYAYVQNVKSSYKDVLAVATFETVETDGKNSIALLCRISENGWYEMRISTMGDSAGRVWIYRYDSALKALDQNPYTNLLAKPYSLDSVPIGDIKNGFSTNTIGFQCNGDTLAVYANGKAMIHPRLKVPIVVTDTNLKEGMVGFGVMSFSSGKAYVEVTNISTNKPQ